MTKTKFILRCAGYAVGKMAGLVLALWLVQGCKTTKPVQHSTIQNDRYYAINQTNMPVYVIRYDTWTVEETDVHDIRDPKFSSELEAEEVMLNELGKLINDFLMTREGTRYAHYRSNHFACQDRIQKLKQQ